MSHLKAVDGAHTVVLDGELDYETSPEFVAVVDGVPVSGGVVELDLSGVPFCDSAGLAALVHAYRRVSGGGGELRVIGIDPRLLRMLEMTGLAHLFTPRGGG
ncbi:STAS domain-containing protein [Actinokineospora soli]|uniref:Anti-sigma factor antagonist n=1 Tax=Actinokineospora soli TaxID=1048753 RepID=A0ABW2TPZ3_9PSEU